MCVGRMVNYSVEIRGWTSTTSMPRFTEASPFSTKTRHQPSFKPSNHHNNELGYRVQTQVNIFKLDKITLSVFHVILNYMQASSRPRLLYRAINATGLKLSSSSALVLRDKHAGRLDGSSGAGPLISPKNPCSPAKLSHMRAEKVYSLLLRS